MIPSLTKDYLWFLCLIFHIRRKFRWSLITQWVSGLSRKFMPFSSAMAGEGEPCESLPLAKAMNKEEGRGRVDTKTFSQHLFSYTGWLWNVKALTISFFLFCLLRNPKLHICVTSLKSSFLRTPGRQSQSWTDTPSCCSDVSFFQSFAAKNISPAFDFIVANNGLWISKYKYFTLESKGGVFKNAFSYTDIQTYATWQ